VFRKGLFKNKDLTPMFIFLIILFCTPSYALHASKLDLKNIPEIVIVDVVDKDIAHYGRWPWSRDVHGKALETLNAQGAKGVYFDFIFSEPDERWPEKDASFSEAIERSQIPAFIPFMFIREGGKDAFSYEVPGIKVDQETAIKRIRNQVLPALPQFAGPATATGYINYFPDTDWVLRKLHLVVRWRGRAYAHMSIAVAAHLCNIAPGEVYLKNRTLHMGPGRIPLGERATLEPDFGKPFKKYGHFSYSDLLEGKLAKEINGRLVIMAFNASGLSDYVVTETSNRYPGSEVLAVSIDHIMRTLLHSSRRKTGQGSNKE
jgi:adenylate cyclase